MQASTEDDDRLIKARDVLLTVSSFDSARPRNKDAMMYINDRLKFGLESKDPALSRFKEIYEGRKEFADLFAAGERLRFLYSILRWVGFWESSIGNDIYKLLMKLRRYPVPQFPSTLVPSLFQAATKQLLISIVGGKNTLEVLLYVHNLLVKEDANPNHIVDAMQCFYNVDWDSELRIYVEALEDMETPLTLIQNRSKYAKLISESGKKQGGSGRRRRRVSSRGRAKKEGRRRPRRNGVR
jgi:hypothetical protein